MCKRRAKPYRVYLVNESSQFEEFEEGGIVFAPTYCEAEELALLLEPCPDGWSLRVVAFEDI